MRRAAEESKSEIGSSDLVYPDLDIDLASLEKNNKQVFIDLQAKLVSLIVQSGKLTEGKFIYPGLGGKNTTMGHLMWEYQVDIKTLYVYCYYLQQSQLQTLIYDYEDYTERTLFVLIASWLRSTTKKIAANCYQNNPHNMPEAWRSETKYFYKLSELFQFQRSGDEVILRNTYKHWFASEDYTQEAFTVEQECSDEESIDEGYDSYFEDSDSGCDEQALRIVAYEDEVVEPDEASHRLPPPRP
ncbi:MAG: hypothetical protein P1U34_08930 [Coxiellaceae bacterium]|nr:hypothetical protein [Coxiellaceae bacterium]